MSGAPRAEHHGRLQRWLEDAAGGNLPRLRMPRASNEGFLLNLCSLPELMRSVSASLSTPAILRRRLLTVKLRGRLMPQAALRSNESHRTLPRRLQRSRGRRTRGDRWELSRSHAAAAGQGAASPGTERHFSEPRRGAPRAAHHGPLQRLLEASRPIQRNISVEQTTEYRCHNKNIRGAEDCCGDNYEPPEGLEIGQHDEKKDEGSDP